MTIATLIHPQTERPLSTLLSELVSEREALCGRLGALHSRDHGTERESSLIASIRALDARRELVEALLPRPTGGACVLARA